ncbi:hypothetical protein DVS77_21590 [Mycolicibacterium moriokaense]|nr:hypothetical protein DVS77_21590 [Mycolicibacterium moriokaense]
MLVFEYQITVIDHNGTWHFFVPAQGISYLLARLLQVELSIFGGIGWRVWFCLLDRVEQSDLDDHVWLPHTQQTIVLFKIVIDTHVFLTHNTRNLVWVQQLKVLWFSDNGLVAVDVSNNGKIINTFQTQVSLDFTPELIIGKIKRFIDYVQIWVYDRLTISFSLINDFFRRISP